MKDKELLRFVMLTIKCFVVLMVIGIFLPKAVDYLLQCLINNTKIYKNSIFVYKLVDKNYKLVYNYILTFYLFFKG
ncbi:endonuclease III [Clostridium sp. CF012]|uniref:endonuclease III n=1 Tax=Clostridium sp. CF012 TaxID=2843319 RepID=UPI001C0E0F5C|nr:endonuclease III [Clostridium sp. CF012]MBU3142174.1 endonuclease III [Clostridium sp. CF012]